MRQRLGVAASLLREPRLLVLDEPANGLDPAGIRDMRALVKRLAASGLTVLLSSHHMDEVEEICDNVTIMRRGIRGLPRHDRRAAHHGAGPGPPAAHHRRRAALALAAGHPRRPRRRDPDGPRRDRPTAEVSAYVAALVRADVELLGLHPDRDPARGAVLHAHRLRRPRADEVTDDRRPRLAPPGLTVPARAAAPSARCGGRSASSARSTARGPCCSVPARPVPVVVVVHGQSRPPKDTLFGRFATDNGFALALLVLGFAGPSGCSRC
jgi:energy-coupling factor transporter ATP-binding protein EcfA2